MEISVDTIWWALAACAAAAATVVITGFSLCGRRDANAARDLRDPSAPWDWQDAGAPPARTPAECLLGGCALTVLLLNLELHALSWLPVERPLRWLPAVHIAVLILWLGANLYLGGRAWLAMLGDSWRAFWSFWREAGWLLSLAVVAFSLIYLVHLVFGAYAVPGAWDELEYHVPMAVQPYQDGRLGVVTSDLPWANAYPRGNELLWTWTLYWTRSDLLFHPVQWAFGVQGLLATYVLARRTGGSIRAATLAVILLGTTPIYFLLVTCGYIDMSVSASVLTILAFLAPVGRAPGAALPGAPAWPMSRAASWGPAAAVRVADVRVADVRAADVRAVDVRTADMPATDVRLPPPPDRQARNRVLAAWLTRDWLLAAFAFAEACLVKLPLTAGLLTAVALLHPMCLARGPWRGVVSAISFLHTRRGLLALVVVALSCHTYWRNGVLHNNPLYPLRVQVGELLLDGPVDSRLFGEGSQSTAGKPVSQMTRVERFYHAWTDFAQPLNADAFGSFGPVVPYLILVPFLVAVLGQGWPVDTWRVTLGLLAVVSYFTPAFLPRYGIPLVGIMLAGMAWFVRRLGRRPRRGFVLVALAACGWGVYVEEYWIRSALTWVITQSGHRLVNSDPNVPNSGDVYQSLSRLPFETRSGLVLEKHPPGDIASPEMVQCIRERSGPGKTLVWNVRIMQSLLWNRTYTNRIIHLPGAAEDSYPSSAEALTEPTPEELQRWVDQVAAIAPEHILVYARSAYAQALEQTARIRYRRVCEDPPERTSHERMVLFERAG